MSCSIVRADFPSFLALELSPQREASIRDHLENCEGCRRFAEEAEPTRLFARLAGGEDEPVVAVDAAAFLAGVRNGIDLKRTELRADEGHHVHRDWWKLAAAAAGIALAGSIWFGSQERAPVRTETPSTVASAEAPLTRTELTSMSAIEDLDREDARVYEFASNSEDDLQVVMIVDQGMDI